MTTPMIPVDYTSKDYAGFRQAMLDQAARSFPEWTGSGNAGDFGVLLIEAFSAMGDILSYYGDRVATEAFITTATQRSSILAIAQLLGYQPHGVIPSTGQVTLALATGTSGPITVPSGTKLITNLQTAIDAPLYFETTTDATITSTAVSVPVVQGSAQGSTQITIKVGMPDQETVLVETLGTSTGEIDQEFSPLNSPVVEGSVRLFVGDVDAGGNSLIREWQYLDDLIDAGPSDDAFSLRYTDSNGVTILLGDGVNGRVPAVGLPVYAYYRVGNGSLGNVVDNQIVDFADPIVGVTVSGSTAMTGGLDPESTDQIRANAPKAFLSQNRAVTTADYESLAVSVPEVSKATALANNANSVAVYVLGANNTAPSSDLIDKAQKYLTTYAMAGTTVTVTAGTTVAVNVGSTTSPVKIGVAATYTPSAVLSAVQQAIQNLLLPENTSFGGRVSLSSAYAAIMAVPGVIYVTIPIFERADNTNNVAADVIFRAWEVPVVGSINVIAEGGLV